MASKSGGSQGMQASAGVSATYPNPLVAPKYMNFLNRAESVAATPYEAYAGQTVAGLTPDQQAAFQQTRGLQGYSQPYFDAARQMTQGAVGGIIPQNYGSTVQAYMNPYTQNVVNATVNQMREENARQMNDLTSQAIMSGGMGGMGSQIARAYMRNQQANTMYKTISDLMYQGYGNAQAQAMAAAQLGLSGGAQMAGLGTSGLQAGMTETQGLLSTGQMQQAQRQTELQDLYSRWQQERQYPYEQTGWLGSMLGAIGPQMGSSTHQVTVGPQQQSGSGTGQIIGGILGGLGMLSGTPLGAAAGSIAGAAAKNLWGAADGGRAHFADGGKRNLSYVPDAPDIRVSQGPQAAHISLPDPSAGARRSSGTSPMAGAAGLIAALAKGNVGRPTDLPGATESSPAGTAVAPTADNWTESQPPETAPDLKTGVAPAPRPRLVGAPLPVERAVPDVAPAPRAPPLPVMARGEMRPALAEGLPGNEETAGLRERFAWESGPAGVGASLPTSPEMSRPSVTHGLVPENRGGEGINSLVDAALGALARRYGEGWGPASAGIALGPPLGEAVGLGEGAVGALRGLAARRAAARGAPEVAGLLPSPRGAGAMVDDVVYGGAPEAQGLLGAPESLAQATARARAASPIAGRTAEETIPLYGPDALSARFGPRQWTPEVRVNPLSEANTPAGLSRPPYNKSFEDWALRRPDQPYTLPALFRADGGRAHFLRGGAGDDMFEEFAPQTAKFEGGWSNDSGGPTRYGISSLANPDVDLGNLTPEGAKQIWKSRYWDTIGAGNLPPDLARVAYDTSIIAGPGRAKQFLAESGGDPAKFMDLRENFMRGLVARNPEKYGAYAKGWANRNAELRRTAGLTGEGAPLAYSGEGGADRGAGVGAINAATSGRRGGADLGQILEMVNRDDAIPAPSAPPQQQGLLSPAVANALMAAGFGMMASDSPNWGQALGQGALMGLGAYGQTLANEREMATEEPYRRLQMEKARQELRSEKLKNALAVYGAQRQEEQRRMLQEAMQPGGAPGGTPGVSVAPAGPNAAPVVAGAAPAATGAAPAAADPYAGKIAAIDAQIERLGPAQLSGSAEAGKMIDDLQKQKEALLRQAGMAQQERHFREAPQQEAEKAASKAAVKTATDRYDQIREAASTASTQLKTLEEMERLTYDPNFTAGFGADARVALKQLGVAVGALNPKATSANELFSSLSAQQMLSAAGGKLSTGVSNEDRKKIEQTVAQQTDTAEGARAKIAIQKKLAERALQVQQWAAQYAAANNGVIDAKFTQELDKWAKENPLMLDAGGVKAQGDPLARARDAISRGADPEKVKQRLRDAGIDATGL